MNYCEKLHKIAHNGCRFNFPFGRNDIESVRNGIYMVFEKGEPGHGGDRIVRIGYNREQGNLFQTIDRHIHGTIENSIFRRLLGECLPQYARNEVNISNRIQANFTFILVKVDNSDYRNRLRKKLIATVAQCRDCGPSKNWLGNNSPRPQIGIFGLWQVQCLGGQEINDDDLEFIETNLIGSD